MSLVRTSLLNAIAVGIRMLAMLGLNKILAVLVGPAGYALFGQFQNAVTVINTFASGAINTRAIFLPNRSQSQFAEMAMVMAYNGQ